MVSKKDTGNEIEHSDENVISAEDEARLNRELGLSESATASLMRRPGGNLYSNVQLREFVDFNDYLATYADEITYAEEIAGTGAEILVGDEWMRLIGTPFAILQWNFTDSSEHNSWFVWLEILDDRNHRFAMTSGHKFGVRDQLYDHSTLTQSWNHVVSLKGFENRDWSWTDPESGKTRTINVPTLPAGVIPNQQNA